ncbi:MAG: bacteriohemerythrin [Nitrosomonadales bacterium]|nr:bacteriohemerythrin [Nitrosomonadales bacterium]
MDSSSIYSGAKQFLVKPLPMFLAAIAVSLLAGNLLFGNLRDGIRFEAQRSISAVGALKTKQIQDWLDSRVANVSTLSGNSFFSLEARQWIRGGARNDARRTLLAERLKAFLDGYRSRAIVLYDSSGRVLLSVGERVPDALARADEACKVAESGELKFIDLHRQNDALLPAVMGFMSPLNEGATCLGAIYLVEDPAQYLFPLMRQWPGESETAETQLVRKDGERVVYLNQLRHRAEQPLEFSLPLETVQLAAAIALRGKQGLLEHALDYRGKQVLSYATAIAGTRWMLISKIDEDEAYRVVDQMQRVAVVFALFFFGAIGAGFWQWRRREQMAADAAVLKERVRADALRMEGEKRFRAVFEHTALPMARNTPGGEFIEVNDAFCSLFGYSREEVSLLHLTWLQITHPDDIEPGLTLVKQMLAGEIPGFRIEKRYIRKDGKVVWGSVQDTLIRDSQGAPEFIVSAIQDISERKQSEQLIGFMAYHDKLTGLPNRALLFDHLSQAMSQAKRDTKNVALLFVDLDGFKAINDRFGHEAGDNVLKMAAQRFLACVRAVDTVARFGGDEFAIILGDLEDPRQAKGVAEKIVQAFAQKMTLSDGNECSVGASVGIGIYPEHGSAMDSLMTAADRAMYESKRRGKNTYTFFRTKSSPKGDFQWVKIDEQHLVGIEEIDGQHRNLAYLVNRLNEALQRNEAPESIAQTIDELLVATTHHFETESRYMTKCHYPEQVAHEAEHARLVREALQFKEQFNQGRELLVLQSIKDWLLDHIVYADRKMAAYLLQHGENV